MVPMAMKPYKNPNLCSSAGALPHGRKKKKQSPPIHLASDVWLGLGEVKQHRHAVYGTWPDNHIIYVRIYIYIICNILYKFRNNFI